MTETRTPEDMVARYTHLEGIRASCVEEQDAIKAALRTRLDVGKHDTSAGTVTITINRRFDPALAATVLASNPELLAMCSTTTVTAAKAKKVLAPVVYESLMKPVGDPTVRIV